MPRQLALLCLLLIAALPMHAAPRFTQRHIVVDGRLYGYQVFLPDGWTAARAWPVVLFLHGSGERGDDNRKQLSQGLPPWLAAHGAEFPAVVVMPQAHEGEYWSGRAERAALRALQASIDEFHGDTQRIYLTGLSMGGYGAWQMAVDHPGLFAAAAIVCGGVRPLPDDPPPAPDLAVEGVPARVDPYGWVADRIRLPVWIFHGGADEVVPTAESRAMHAALQARGREVRYSEFPGVNHGSWVPAYATPGLWPWMFSHRLAQAPR